MKSIKIKCEVIHVIVLCVYNILWNYPVVNFNGKYKLKLFSNYIVYLFNVSIRIVLDMCDFSILFTPEGRRETHLPGTGVNGSGFAVWTTVDCNSSNLENERKLLKCLNIM